MKYIITNTQPLTPSSLLLTLEPKGNAALQFQPGQYAALQFKRHGRPTPARCFSIVSTPNSKGIIQFGVRVTGKFTRALQQLRIGDELLVSGGYGSFSYDGQYDKHAVFLASGIGITPILSIIDAALRDNPKNTLTLLYGVRDQEDAPFTKHLLRLEQQYSNFKTVFFITTPPIRSLAGQQVINSRISTEYIAEAAHHDFVQTSFFICGSPGFSGDLSDFLRSQGTPASRINLESFNRIHHAEQIKQQRPIIKKLSSVYVLSVIAFLFIASVVTVTGVKANSESTAKVVTSTTKSSSTKTATSTTAAAKSSGTTSKTATTSSTSTPSTTPSSSTKAAVSSVS